MALANGSPGNDGLPGAARGAALIGDSGAFGASCCDSGMVVANRSVSPPRPRAEFDSGLNAGERAFGGLWWQRGWRWAKKGVALGRFGVYSTTMCNRRVAFGRFCWHSKQHRDGESSRLTWKGRRPFLQYPRSTQTITIFGMVVVLKMVGHLFPYISKASAPQEMMP